MAEDPESQTIYKAWLAHHKGTDRVSGSKTADMKAAASLRSAKTRLSSSRPISGAEGINLQFCSLLVNYDLPWHQRVEQRIGGVIATEKIDVNVVNLLNTKPG